VITVDSVAASSVTTTIARSGRSASTSRANGPSRSATGGSDSGTTRPRRRTQPSGAVTAPSKISWTPTVCGSGSRSGTTIGAAARTRSRAPTTAAGARPRRRSGVPRNGRTKRSASQPQRARKRPAIGASCTGAPGARQPVPSATHGALANDHRALPDQERRADPDDDRRGARGEAPRRGLEPVQPARRRRAHRPADRLGHGRDESRAVGRHPARRRELRRLPVVVPLPRRGDRAVPVPPRHPDPPGSGGREDPVQRHRRARARSSRRTPTSTRPAPTSSSRAPRRSTASSPRAVSRRRSTRSRATWTSTRSTR
jgi:hypothetical protein